MKYTETSVIDQDAKQKRGHQHDPQPGKPEQQIFFPGPCTIF